MQKVSFVCDICKKEFTARNEKGEINAVGGMEGFFRKMIPNPETKVLEKKVLQYHFDFCEDCNKKMVGYYIKLGGK